MGDTNKEKTKVYISPSMAKKTIERKKTDITNSESMYEWIKGKIVDIKGGTIATSSPQFI